MSDDLLDRYDRLREQVQDARFCTDTAKTRYDEARAKQRALEKKLDAARADIKRAIEIANDAPRPRRKEKAPRPEAPPPRSPPAPEGIRLSFWELLLAVPPDGDVEMADLRAAFPDLNDGAINTRVTKAKKAGLLESASYGRHRLTAKARKIVGRQHLQVVNNE